MRCSIILLNYQRQWRKPKKIVSTWRHKFSILVFRFRRHFPYFYFHRKKSSFPQASEKETIPKDDKKEDEPAKDTNGEKNGVASETASAPAAEKQKLSLGEIAAVDGEIAKAKTEQLQVLHNVSLLKSSFAHQTSKIK